MMLKTVKAELHSFVYPDFNSFFQAFVMDVQDENLSYELEYLVRHNKLTPTALSAIIEHTLEVVSTYGSGNNLTKRIR